MRRKIPSTAALVSFESAARHESFTKAAEELSLMKRRTKNEGYTNPGQGHGMA